MRILRLFALFSLGTIIFVMWYPQRYLFGVDLSNQALQDIAFAVCTFFWILARGSRLRSDPYYEFRSSSQTIDSIPIKRNVLRIASELVLLASLLEFGQHLLPNRVSAFNDFLLNSTAVIFVGALCYVVIAMALRTAHGRRFIQFLVTLD